MTRNATSKVQTRKTIPFFVTKKLQQNREHGVVLGKGRPNTYNIEETCP